MTAGVGLVIVYMLIDVVRVRRYVEGQDFKLISMKWAPFGPGWLSFGRKNSTIYEIEYTDPLGKTFSEYVRVSLWQGVEKTG